MTESQHVGQPIHIGIDWAKGFAPPRTVTCRRCQRVRHVSPLAMPFTYWFCHKREDGRYCWTHNIVEQGHG